MTKYLLAALALALAARAADAPDKAKAKDEAAVAKVFDLTVLHSIQVIIASKDVASVERRTDTRVSCTFIFDGVKIENVGVRQAGGDAHPYKRINNKPSLSIKFDEFVNGQDLYGLDKLVLKNELQDMSFVNEHLTYEVFRRAGIAAPITAHAVVTINGILSGIYLMREPINKQFLTRNFGKANSDGNLYEEDLRSGDFANNPRFIDLKNEQEEKRSRQDILTLSVAVRAATPSTFVSAVGRLVDLDTYITHYAVEAATSDFDGFSFHHNNAYLYFRPSDGKMIVVTQGADEAFWATGTPITRLRSPLQEPASLLSQRLLQVPELKAKLTAEILRVGSAPVWDKKVLHDRFDQVKKIFATAKLTGQTATDIARFNEWTSTVEHFIDSGGTTYMLRR